MPLSHDGLVAEIQRRAAKRSLLTHYCQRSTSCTGRRGMPDLIIAGIHGTAFLEIKTMGQVPEPGQTTWIYTLRASGQNAYVIHEADLANGSVDDLLARCAGAFGK